MHKWFMPTRDSENENGKCFSNWDQVQLNKNRWTINILENWAKSLLLPEEIVELLEHNHQRINYFMMADVFRFLWTIYDDRLE